MKKLVAGIGIVGLCALCCALPVIGIAGVAGIVGISFGYWKWGVLLIALALSAFLILKTVKNNRTCSARTGCNCSSGSCNYK
ncbi:hypothetical protein ACFQ3N_13730 [Virgibacillus byunsanensis]|uniref:Mercury transporter n=1 Tax=Virgibacillus byunsanensis TaxID=570945 RepID=A0ABW3LRG1_9BACI